MLNKDYKEMLQCLSDEGVKFLLVGAYALAGHGFSRAVKDVDFFVWANAENAAKLLRALDRFGALFEKLSSADFACERTEIQIGAGPRRIDILTRIDGVKFEDVYGRRLTLRLEGVEVPVISRDDLIANKRASGRAQDLADVERLTGRNRSCDDERSQAIVRPRRRFRRKIIPTIELLTRVGLAPIGADIRVNTYKSALVDNRRAAW